NTRLLSDNTNQCDCEREKNAKVKQPKEEKFHFEITYSLGPTKMPFENRSRAHAIGRKPDKKHGRQNRSANEFEEWQSRIRPGQEKNDEDDAKGDKRVDMKQRHGGIEDVFRPDWQ